MKRGWIKVTTVYERFVHWMLALSFLTLCMTGLGMMYHAFHFIGTIMGGLVVLKYVHNFTGLIFIVALVLAIRMWWHEAGIFHMPEDLEWMKCAGGYLWHVDDLPEVGKYNPGQKAFFLAVVFFGGVMVVTGLIMWFPLSFPTWLTRWMFAFHALGFFVLFPFFFVHFYLGTAGSPGSCPAMFTGWMKKAWLIKQHPRWLRELEAKGKLEVYEE